MHNVQIEIQIQTQRAEGGLIVGRGTEHIRRMRKRRRTRASVWKVKKKNKKKEKERKWRETPEKIDGESHSR